MNENQFLARLERRGNCLEYVGNRLPKGYGTFYSSERRRRVYAHRLAYEIAFGPIPPRLEVCHRCDNPPCVLPSHLFLGSRADNALDMVAKGRALAGIKNPMARLTLGDVMAIRWRFAANPVPLRRLARIYEVSPSAIRKLLLGVTWPDVPGAITRECLRQATRKTQPGARKLSAAQAASIAAEYAGGGGTLRSLAAKHGISPSLVFGAVQGGLR